MTARFVSADLLFQAQNAAIELAQKLGAAEARIVELETKASMLKSLANQSFGKLGPTPSPLYDPELSEKVTQTARDVMGELYTHQIRVGEPRVSSMPRQPGKSTLHYMLLMQNLITMIRQLTQPADPEGRGWARPSLEYVTECRNRIKGLI